MISLVLVLALALGICPAAFAAEAEPIPEVDIISDLTRGANWPTDFKNISKTPYSGEIKNIAVGNGVYASYYFNCNSYGKLRVEATLTSKGAAGFTSSKCVIELYDAVSHDLIDTYDPGFEAYNETFIANTFTGLTSGKNYVVRFVNKTSLSWVPSGDSYSLRGPITVKWP